jgi:hypothetical protein
VVDIWYKHLLTARSAIATALDLDFTKRPPSEMLAKSFMESGEVSSSSDAFYAATAPDICGAWNTVD